MMQQQAPTIQMVHKSVETPQDHDRLAYRKSEVSLETESAAGLNEMSVQCSVSASRLSACSKGASETCVADNTTEEVSVLTQHTEDLTRELREIRQVVEFLVRRERKLDVKTDVTVRLERLEKENDQWKTRSTTLAERTRVVKQVVDTWLVDDRRDRVHPLQRRARCRGPHDRCRRVGAGL